MYTVKLENSVKRQIFVQSELLDDVAILEVASTIKFNQLREQLLELLPQDERKNIHIYIEDLDDEEALKKLIEVPDGLRVQLHRHKSIDVIVHYAGRKLLRSFRPSITVARVKKWATHELGITASDAAEMALQISGSDSRPDPDTHIGTLNVFPAKSVSFDLVPSPRVNG